MRRKSVASRQRKTMMRKSLDGMTRFDSDDSVQIKKPGSMYGKLATVVNPSWQGRVQVSMGDGAIKSYLVSRPQASELSLHTADSYLANLATNTSPTSSRSARGKCNFLVYDGVPFTSSSTQ